MYSSPAWPNVHLMQWTAEHIGGAPHSLDEDLESVTIKTRKTKACEEKCIIKQHLRWFERCLLFLDDWMSDWFSRKKNRKERNGHVTHGSFCLAARPDPEEPLLFSLPNSKARIPAQPSFSSAGRSHLFRDTGRFGVMEIIEGGLFSLGLSTYHLDINFRTASDTAFQRLISKLRSKP